MHDHFLFLYFLFLQVSSSLLRVTWTLAPIFLTQPWYITPIPSLISVCEVKLQRDSIWMLLKLLRKKRKKIFFPLEIIYVRARARTHTHLFFLSFKLKSIVLQLSLIYKLKFVNCVYLRKTLTFFILSTVSGIHWGVSWNISLWIRRQCYCTNDLLQR